MSFRAIAISLAVLPVLLTSSGAGAQTAPTAGPAAVPPSAATVGFMHAIHATNNVETTLASTPRCSACAPT